MPLLCGTGDNRQMKQGRFFVTGASRREGIAWAVVQRLVADGARVVVQAWPAGEARDLEALDVRVIEANLANADAPAEVLAAAVEHLGGLDGLVATHAHSSSLDVRETNAADLDAAWAINARASFLLTQAFAALPEAQGGSVVLFTSGQHLGPMADEAAYAVSKGAIHQMTLTLADALSAQRIRVNALNPGPVDTGWADGALHEDIRRRFPSGRWTTPEEIAGVVRWLLSPESAVVTGQVINAEAGFRRW